jgi:thiamine-phosphate pyrophosphorylase
VDIALLSDADGVHLGQSDIPIEDARDLLGDDRIIGISVHNAEEAKDAESRGADYVSVGSIFRTSTKHDAQHGRGLDAVFTVKKAVGVPVMAIGGINRGNIQDVIRAGADGVAVVSAVVSQKDVKAAAHELRDMILKVRPNI